VSSVLVTGAAGYIGAHMAHALVRAGHEVVALDDLSRGHAEDVPSGARFVRGDVRDRALVTGLLREHGVRAVFHFASRIEVGESVTEPRVYFRDNVVAAFELLESVLDAGVPHFVLSSSAAVYGAPSRVPIEETDPTVPVNPYGETKLTIERMLASYGHAYGLKYAALRYFNAAGADADAGIGERHDPETHLVPLVLDVAQKKRPSVTIFGSDYATPDGTCVRDFVHVVDLVEAHLAALHHLEQGGAGGAFNLGSGEGHSVREVIDVARRVTGHAVEVVEGPRRPGDPPVLVASPARALRELGWRAKRSSLETIVTDAWRYRSAAAGRSTRCSSEPAPSR
jgi:UDP-glucose 4-epimerase